MIATRELADSFTPSNEEIEWARDMTLSDPHLLALAVWLKSYQRLGSLSRLDEAPQVVVEHVREALRLPADVIDLARWWPSRTGTITRRPGMSTKAPAAPPRPG